MKIHVKGPKGTKTELVRSIAEFAAAQLGLHKYDKDLYIYVLHPDSLRARLDAFRGIQAAINRDIEDGIHIRIHPLAPGDSVKSIAHELTHAADMLSGRLVADGEGNVWDGQYYDKGYPYAVQPWELRAERTASDITREFYRAYKTLSK